MRDKGIGRQKKNSSKRELGNNYFFGIGIDVYKDDKKWPTLNNAVKDVLDIQRVLVYKYGINKTKLLLDKDANRNAIIKYFRKLINIVKSNDKLIIYYSGHGLYDKATDSGFWIPTNAAEDFGDYLSNEEVRNFISKIDAWQIFLISDSCFSGTILLNKKRNQNLTFDALELYNSRWGFCSGMHDQIASDGKAGENSPFAAGILKVLLSEQEDFAASTLITVVTEFTESNHKEQVPIAAPLFNVGHVNGEYIFRLKDSSYHNPIKPSPSNTAAIVKINRSKAHFEQLDENNAVFTDGRDRNQYRVIRLLDGRWWLSENLRYFTANGSYCYNSNPINCKKYGNLYTWEASLEACPEGWQIPQKEDWIQLEALYGYERLDKDGASGFNTLLGGCLRSNGKFDYLETFGFYWSNTKQKSGKIWYANFGSPSNSIYLRYGEKSMAFSCRVYLMS